MSIATSKAIINIVQSFFVCALYFTLFLMSKKFCPAGFFSFYVNKQEAQVGGGHHCVEENCAIWNEEYEECSLKVGLDAITALAENLGGQARTSNRTVEVEAPKLSIFDKLRRKTEGQKLPVVDQSITPLPPPPPPPPPVANIIPLGSLTTPSVIKAAPAPTPTPTPTPAPAPAPAPPPIPPVKNDELKPPNIPVNELPVISVSIEES